MRSIPFPRLVINQSLPPPRPLTPILQSAGLAPEALCIFFSVWVNKGPAACFAFQGPGAPIKTGILRQQQPESNKLSMKNLGDFIFRLSVLYRVGPATVW